MIKNVQIRSFVKGGNHGQYLQALGLADLVRRLLPNAHVSHLNYENHFIKELKIQTFSGLLPKFLLMRYFWRKNLKFTSIDSKVDLSIYGADMIWHLDSVLFPPDKIMFGERDMAKLKVSYAPSVGYRIEDEPKWIDELLNQFYAVGVRDENTSNFVMAHSNASPKLVIDPCFHLMNSDYANCFSNQKKSQFISVYSPMTSGLVEYFKKGLELEALPSWFKNYKYLGYFPKKRFFIDLPKQFTNPLWTVKQISISKFLITNTFHGVMMALMTRTPFIAVISPNLTARLQSPIAETFSSSRLMTLEQFKNLNNEQLTNYLSDEDLDQIKLNEYISESEVWLKTQLI